MALGQIALHLCDRVMCARDGHDWVRVRAELGDTVVVRSQCCRCGAVDRVEAAWQDLRAVP